jgi:hypothetical protein
MNLLTSVQVYQLTAQGDILPAHAHFPLRAHFPDKRIGKVLFSNDLRRNAAQFYIASYAPLFIKYLLVLI